MLIYKAMSHVFMDILVALLLTGSSNPKLQIAMRKPLKQNTESGPMERVRLRMAITAAPHKSNPRT